MRALALALASMVAIVAAYWLGADSEWRRHVGCDCWED